MLKCFSFPWYSSDQTNLVRIIAYVITGTDLEDHSSIFCNRPLMRSSDVSNSSVNNFRSKLIEDRDTKWVSMCFFWMPRLINEIAYRGQIASVGNFIDSDCWPWSYVKSQVDVLRLVAIFGAWLGARSCYELDGAHIFLCLHKLQGYMRKTPFFVNRPFFVSWLELKPLRWVQIWWSVLPGTRRGLPTAVFDLLHLERFSRHR